MKKKLSFLLLALVTVAAFAVQTARRAGTEASYSIVFKDTGTTSDANATLSAAEDMIAEGLENVASVTKAEKVYLGRQGRGLKLGTGSVNGELTLKLAQAVKPTKITVKARKYSNSNNTATMNGKEFTLSDETSEDCVIDYDGNTSVDEIVIVGTPRVYIISITVAYDASSAPAVNVPTITGETPFMGSTEATIACSTEGAKIYYTLDGSEPTAESTEYTAPIALTATTTVKAIAIKGSDKSAVASKTFTAQTAYENLKALQALENNATFGMAGELQVVAKPTNKYVYVKDATGSGLIFDNGGTKTVNLEKGKTIAANWTGKVSIYKQLFELVPDDVLAVKEGDAAKVTYPTVDASYVSAEHINEVVTLKGITSYTIEGKNITLKIGETEIAAYNQFGLTIADPVEGKTYEVIGAISRYDDKIQFQPIEIAAVEDIEISPASGDISAALAAASEGKIAKNITINLTKDAAYTISAPIVAPASITINGAEGATIDASALTDNLIQMAAVENPTEWTPANVTIKNIIVKGLKKALFYSTNKKYVAENFVIDNCVVEQAGDATTIDYTKGSTAKNITVTNSTFYAPTATTKSFYSSQSGEKYTEYDASGVQTFTFKNNTMYNLAYGKNFFSHRQANQTWLAYDVEDNIFVNCGKKEQVIKGMNGGQSGKNPTWTIKGNIFNYDGADTSAKEDTGDTTEGENVQNSIAGIVTFEDAAAGKFGGNVELPYGVEKPAAQPGDARWTLTYTNAPQKFTVNLAAVENGTVTTDATGALAEGTLVTITATPNEGYELGAITVTGVYSNLAVVVTDGKFTMPADDVTVTVTFKVSTGIQNVSVENNSLENATFYDLNGRRVENPTKKGIYIVNGKKVVIK